MHEQEYDPDYYDRREAMMCVVCSDKGCEHCPAEPFPEETWELFTDLKDIQRLIVDAQAEVERRQKQLNEQEDAA